jgi:hypothetical protein
MAIYTGVGTLDEFREYCKNALETNGAIVSKWLNGADPFKKALAELITVYGERAQ